MNRTEKRVAELVAPTIEALGCECWGVEYLSQGKHSKLRVYIDKADGVTIEDCEAVSRQISDLLDVDETITSQYVLEVSSPGLDRILFQPEQYAHYVGEVVDVRLNYPFEGRRRFVGTLSGVEDDQAVVQVDQMEYVLPLENVQRARIVPQFD